MSNKIIIRILGNDLNMHGENQTYINLKFTLENEKNFKDTSKLFILNKIINETKKNKIINLLNKHSIKYIDFPFDKTELNKLKNNNNWTDIELFFKKNVDYQFVGQHRKYILNKLKPFNQYIINNNGMRNFAIEYGKKYNYEWIFVLDSNNFIIENDYDFIFSNLNPDTEYIILPTKRLTDNDLENSDIFNCEKLVKLNLQEPQIVFKNTSQISFNKDIPYGASPKVELLQVLGIKGKWDEWKDYEKWYNIKCRKQYKVNYQILSKIIRLKSSDSKNNNTRINWYNRIIGLYYLLKNL